MQIIKINAIWCSGCLVMNPIMKKIEENHPEIEFISYDYDMDEEIIKEYNIGKIIPVLIFKKNGKEITRLIGEKKQSEIEDTIERVKNEEV